MRSRFTLIITTLSLWLIAATSGHAASMADQVGNGIDGVGKSIFETPDARTNFLGKLMLIVNYLLDFIGILFFLLILYAGWTWMFARGNSDAIEKSKSMFSQAILGLIIILTARIITEFILNQIGQAVSI